MAPSGPSLLAIFRQHRTVPAVLLVVIALALVNWILSPDQALRWLRGMLALPALCLCVALWHLWMLRSRRRRGMDDDSGLVRYSGSAIELVCLAVGIRQIIVFGMLAWDRTCGDGVISDPERRIAGLATSAMFVVIGNRLPKILTPLSVLPREKAEVVTAARRFVGATWLVLGLAAALAFVSAPLPLAVDLLQWTAGAGVLTILGAIVWMNTAPARRAG